MVVGEEKIRDFGKKHTATFKMDNQQGPIVQHIEFSSILYGTLDGRGHREEWLHVYVWLSPFAVHLKIPQYC